MARLLRRVESGARSIFSWPASFGESDSDFYVAESRGRSAMARSHRLHGLALSAVGRAPKRPIVARTDCIAAIPKFGGDAAVAGVFDHAAFFSAFDFPANFRRELEMIPAIVDRPGTIRLEQDCIVGVGGQIVVLPCTRIDAD